MNEQNLTTLEFDIGLTCNSAEGMKSGSLLNGKASGTITVKGDLQGLQAGNGTVTVAGAIKTITNPDGSDGIALLKGKSTFPAVQCELKGHKLVFKQDLSNGAITLTVTASLLDRGRTVLGTAAVEVNKWLWTLILKRASASFQGSLKPECY